MDGTHTLASSARSVADSRAAPSWVAAHHRTTAEPGAKPANMTVMESSGATVVFIRNYKIAFAALALFIDQITSRFYLDVI